MRATSPGREVRPCGRRWRASHCSSVSRRCSPRADDEELKPGYFPGHPYAAEDVRFIHADGEPKQPENLETFDSVRYKPWSVRLAVKDGNDFHGLNRTGARLVADTACRFGLRANWDVFRERLPCGCVDYSGMGDANLVYRIAQADWISV